jgi:hypothetical protein
LDDEDEGVGAMLPGVDDVERWEAMRGERNDRDLWIKIKIKMASNPRGEIASWVHAMYLVPRNFTCEPLGTGVVLTEQAEARNGLERVKPGRNYRFTVFITGRRRCGRR